ncbi:MAG: SDR family NAD(P)-dependent oxidoreductase [Verrucomicrobiota bacterium]
MALDRKTALVTGAGRGLGEALARRLAEGGYAVAVHYRTNQEGAERVAAEIRANGGEALALGADLARESEAQRLVGELQAWAGRLDVLVNNAGLYQPEGLEELTEEGWYAGLNSTASATFFATRACLPLLRAAAAGRVVNIGDSSADRPTARDLAVGYHVGKTGVLMLTRSFARQEAPHGITVNQVSPGYLENSADLDEAPPIPAGRYGSFEDIWHAVSFLLGPEAGYLNGSNLVISGGWNLR